MRVLPALLLLSLVTACGDDDGGPVDASGADAQASIDGSAVDGPAVDAPAADAPGLDARAPDAAPDDATPVLAEITCEADTSAFPPIDRSCHESGDCAVALHQFNCCGSKRAIGIASSALPTFAVAEASCEGMYPACGCAEQPTVAEDGRNETQGPIEVECTVDGCRTYVP